MERPGHRDRTDTRLYRTATARAWHRLHPRLTHRTAWVAHAGALPIIEGTVVLLNVDRLPSGATAKPVWLWWSQPEATTAEVDLLWQAFLRRCDIEHTFRMLKQTLGWTTPKLRDPDAADRWTWLVLAAYTQLRLARTAVTGRRRPWERRPPANRLSPRPRLARVSEPTRHSRQSRHRTRTLPTKTRPPTRPPQPPPRHPPRRPRSHQPETRPWHQETHEIDGSKTTPHRLKIKLVPRPHRGSE
ncbi:transposase [Asanoa sp. WMMD1127]|nr:transposase [Asanoa sp. WMMD1127]MDG4824969.1 transposase [Asanoa sp. WMMD1127]